MLLTMDEIMQVMPIGRLIGCKSNCINLLHNFIYGGYEVGHNSECIQAIIGQFGFAGGKIIWETYH
jgi:hypothetical protein